MAGYRGEAWRAAGATGEGTAILLHYTAMRLASEVRAISEQAAGRLGRDECGGRRRRGAEAAAGGVHGAQHGRPPRAAAVTANLARASDQLATAAEGIDALFAAARDVATIISPPV